MSNEVLTYNMKDDLFIVYKNGRVFVSIKGVEDWYDTIREYEQKVDYILEELYPSGIILMAKQRLGWKIYSHDGHFYEVLPDKNVYRLDKDKAIKIDGLPAQAKKSVWSKHPYRIFL